jgi:type VI secretion system protein ImpK
MQLVLWTAIVGAHARVRQLVDAALAGGGGTIGRAGALRLHADVRAALATLKQRLGATQPESAVFEAMLPLVIHADELITARLGEDDAASWPLLQQELYGVEAGGDLFYQLADQRLAAPAAGPLTLEVLLFCLQSGFLGRGGEDPETLASYRARLAAAIPEPPLPLPAPPRVLRVRTPARSGAVYYAVTIAVILLLPVLALYARR